MKTANLHTSLRSRIPKLMQNLQILYQNGEISREQKNAIVHYAQTALISGDVEDLKKSLQTLRLSSTFPHVVDECIELVLQ